MKLSKLLLSIATILSVVFGGAIWNYARAITVEQKLFQIGGPETRTRCVQEWRTKGVPNCNVVNWTLRCEDTWISGCSGWATDFMQHEFFLIVTGPDAPQKAPEKILRNALQHALAAAAAAAIATPGEAALKTAAGFTAFRTVLYADLSVEPILNGMKDQYKISIKTTSDW